MNELSTSEIMGLMDAARFDSAGQLRNVIRRFNSVVDGDNRLVDPTNPLVFLMEMACAGAANTAIHHETEMRRKHPMLALIKEDLYYHLTDRQYSGIFAIPPETVMGMILPVEDILTNAVEVGTTGVRVLTIAKNTVWTVGGYEFTLEYPIEFRITPGGSLTVGFGNPAIPALHPLSSNIISPEPVNYDGYDSIRFEFPIRQMSIHNEIIRLNRASSAVGNVVYSDKYHYLRAFVRRSVAGVRTWVEIRTTHSEHVYDPAIPTLLVRDLGGEVRLTLPVVYHTNDLVGDEIRVDIYTTKAKNDVILSEYAAGQWLFEPRDYDNSDNGKYTSPFQRMNTVVSYSADYTRNGRDELTFEEIRERITEVHYGDVDLPITNVNRELKLKDMGFNSMRATDAVTTRSFNATRKMPTPTDGYLINPINVGVFNTLLRPSDLDGVNGININGDRTTIHPTVLFKETEGAITIVNEDERQLLRGLSGDLLARTVSNGNYLFTPFYNVIDSTNNNFALRTYHLDAPEVKGRQFIRDNNSLVLDLYTSQGVTLERTPTGYRLIVLTASGEAYRSLRDDQVGVQLSYRQEGTAVSVVMLGELVSKDDQNNRLWSFEIETNHDLTANKELIVSNFISTGGVGQVDSRMPLTIDMDLCYFVFDYPLSGVRRSEIDQEINQGVVPNETVGILQERLEIVFGEQVSNLWTGARPIVLPEDYEVYDHDLPRLHDKPVYLRDANDELVVSDDGNGNLVVQKIAEVGDPVLDPLTGLPEYHYKKGETVYADGAPVVKNPRMLTRQLDLVLFDGLFAFANDRSSIDYVNYVRRNIVQWSRDDMSSINDRVLEETVFRFRPTSTIGAINCVVGEGGDVVIDARQTITVEYLMTENDWKNESLKSGMRAITKSLVVAEFSKSSIAVDNIILALKKNVPSSILGVSVKNLGGEDNNYALMTLKDGSGQPSIRMKLEPLPNDEYTVVEDINILFIPHLPARSDK